MNYYQMDCTVFFYLSMESFSRMLMNKLYIFWDVVNQFLNRWWNLVLKWILIFLMVKTIGAERKMKYLCVSWHVMKVKSFIRPANNNFKIERKYFPPNMLFILMLNKRQVQNWKDKTDNTVFLDIQTVICFSPLPIYIYIYVCHAISPQRNSVILIEQKKQFSAFSPHFQFQCPTCFYESFHNSRN